MGCGSSSGLGLRPRSRRTAASSGDGKERKLSVRGPVPFINVTFGSNVDKSPPKVIFVFGGPGSHKGHVVGSLQSMFGMKLISSEAIILKFLPQKVGNIVSISTTEEILELVHREPQQVPLDWVMGLVQDEVESEPDQMFIVDLIPNLKWLMKSSSLFKECDTVLEEFERKVPISFALHLSLGEESLDKTLDYSHHSTNLPPGATLADEADNSKAKSRFLMHEKAVQPFVQYFQSCDRLVSVDVSSGASEAIVDRIHQVFTSLNLQAWRPVNTVLVFAMNGLKAGNLDLSVCCDMSLIVLSEITTEPEASAETLLGSLSEHINALADISHYFVIDPSNTTLQKASVGDVLSQKSSCVL
ncbi:uncharacterized protein LOC135333213 isoform X2 [Halichondria panicea]|uniref:uncharacterized protein LOC135333213 isoform X2 n=1 Tax=Halichondria panicea TaxID=6063 RepID=UPI00312B736D